VFYNTLSQRLPNFRPFLENIGSFFFISARTIGFGTYRKVTSISNLFYPSESKRIKRKPLDFPMNKYINKYIFRRSSSVCSVHSGPLLFLHSRVYLRRGRRMKTNRFLFFRCARSRQRYPGKTRSKMKCTYTSRQGGRVCDSRLITEFEKYGVHIRIYKYK
jgi:hypothetical protein